MKSQIILSKEEMAQIIADHFAAKPDFHFDSMIDVEFKLTNGELYCILEGI